MIIQQVEECSENATVLCICVSSVGECKVVSFVFLSIRSATLVREGWGLFHLHTYRISKACFFAVQKNNKVFHVILLLCDSESWLPTVESTCNYNCKLFQIFFENASCKRLVLALVGFGLASFETRFKKLTNTCTRTHIKYLQAGAVHHQNFA